MIKYPAKMFVTLLIERKLILGFDAIRFKEKGSTEVLKKIPYDICFTCIG